MNANEGKHERNAAIVIMAAGKGTRMKSGLPKVMMPVLGKPMLAYVLDTARTVASGKIIVIAGHKREQVIERFSAPDVEFVTQEPQLGTGHAVAQAGDALSGFSGDVVVLSGDVPLLRKETIESMLDLHRKTGAAVTVLTFEPEDTASYGRIIRDGEKIVANVEAKDASEEQLKIREANSGVYVFKSSFLFPALGELKDDNVQKEYYLTDLINIASQRGLVVSGLLAGDPSEVLGANTTEDLETLEKELARRGKSDVARHDRRGV